MNDRRPPPTMPSATVHGTEILATDTRQQYREKIARTTLDAMVQFVGPLDAQGTVLEINKAALHAVGIKLSDVERKAFWTSFCWQVSPEINQGIRDAIARVATRLHWPLNPKTMDPAVQPPARIESRQRAL